MVLSELQIGIKSYDMTFKSTHIQKNIVFRLVMKNVAPLFEVENFEDILVKTKEVSKKLKSLGCFKTVNMLIDTLPDHPQHYQVKVVVTETNCHPFLHLGLGCPQENVGAGSVTMGLSNMFGGGEKLYFDIMKGHSKYQKVCV